MNLTLKRSNRKDLQEQQTWGTDEKNEWREGRRRKKGRRRERRKSWGGGGGLNESGRRLRKTLVMKKEESWEERVKKKGKGFVENDFHCEKTISQSRECGGRKLGKEKKIEYEWAKVNGKSGPNAIDRSVVFGLDWRLKFKLMNKPKLIWKSGEWKGSCQEVRQWRLHHCNGASEGERWAKKGRVMELQMDSKTIFFFFYLFSKGTTFNLCDIWLCLRWAGCCVNKPKLQKKKRKRNDRKGNVASGRSIDCTIAQQETI